MIINLDIVFEKKSTHEIDVIADKWNVMTGRTGLQVKYTLGIDHVVESWVFEASECGTIRCGTMP